MSRSGYTDDYEYLGLWRGTVERAIQGKRGQLFLRKMAEALDAMPEKELAKSVLVNQENGSCCAMGAVAMACGIDVSIVDPDERDDVAKLFDIAPAMAAEIAYQNDECEDRHWSYVGPCPPPESPGQRWQRMRKWVEKNLRETKA